MDPHPTSQRRPPIRQLMLNFQMRFSGQAHAVFVALLFASSLSVPSASSVVNASSSSQNPQSPSIQIAVNRVNVGVVVTDPQGNFVPDLRRENFHIFDNGVEQPITDFANVISPAEVFLLVAAGPAGYF